MGWGMDFSYDWPPQSDAIPKTCPHCGACECGGSVETRPWSSPPDTCSDHVCRPPPSQRLWVGWGLAGPGEWASEGGLQELGVRGFEKRLLGGGM